MRGSFLPLVSFLTSLYSASEVFGSADSEESQTIYSKAIFSEQFQRRIDSIIFLLTFGRQSLCESLAIISFKAVNSVSILSTSLPVQFFLNSFTLFPVSETWIGALLDVSRRPCVSCQTRYLTSLIKCFPPDSDNRNMRSCIDCLVVASVRRAQVHDST
jgi:hypothetical protein